MVSWICRKNKSSWEVTGGLVVRILGHCGGPGSIPGLKTKILKAAWHSQREKKLLHLLKYLISTDWLTHTLNKKLLGLPWWLRQQRICLQCRRSGFDPWVRKIPRRENGNSLKCAWLENSMDRGAWQVTVHWVAKSRTQLRTNTHTEMLGLPRWFSG